MCNHLCAWRKHTGHTLQDVANLLKKTHTTVLRYERGEMDPPAPVRIEIAKIFGCTPSELDYHPRDRERGQRLHQAMELAKTLEPELAERWLAIGRLLALKG